MVTALFRAGCALVLMLGVVLGQPALAAAQPLGALPFVGNLAGDRPTNLGVKEGKLAPCPRSPNCVVSQGAEDDEHRIAPLTYSGDPAPTFARLETVVKAMPRTDIIDKTDAYLYAEFTSQWMGYVDDVEFYLDPAESAIQVRSASRLGESDLGVNRKRIEAIRAALESDLNR